MSGAGVFEQALEVTLAYEGGFVDHPEDPGGRTNMGITQRTLSAWLQGQDKPDRDVIDLDPEEVAEIYRHIYWNGIRAETLPPALAVVAFDCAVNHGPTRALQWLSEGADDPVALTICRMEHYTHLSTWSTFGKGWSRRAYGVLGFANRLEREGVT